MKPTFDICPNINDSVKPCISYIKGGHCSRPDTFRCLMYLQQHEMRLSYSFMKDFSHCHRKAWHGWIEGKELIEKSEALQNGIMASKILGVLHDRKKSEYCVDAYHEFINEEIEKSMDPDDPDSVGSLRLWGMKTLFDAYIHNDIHTMKGIPELYFNWKEPDYPNIHGYIDLAVLEDENHIPKRAIEFKYTQNPDWYDMFNMYEQIGIYFLGVPTLESIQSICLVAPIIKFKKTEKITEVYERNLDHLKKSLSNNMIKRTYYRNEFDYELIKRRAKMISQEIVWYLQKGSENMDPMYHWYQDRQACHTPECDFLPICKTGTIPENLYTKRSINR